MTITWRIPSWLILVVVAAVLATTVRKVRKPIPYVSLTNEKTTQPMLTGQSILTPTQAKMADILAAHQQRLAKYETTIVKLNEWTGAR